MSADATAASSGNFYTRPVVGALALAAFVGLLWGVIGSLVNLARWPWLQVLSQITGQPWSWCVFAFLIGFALRRVSWSPLLGITGVVAGMAGYYGTDLLRGVYTLADGGVKWDWLLGDFTAWTKIGVLVGAVFAFAGALSRRGGILGALASLAPPAAVMYPSILAGQPLGEILFYPSPLGWLTLAATVLSLILLARAVVVAALQQRRRNAIS